ncbi:MAG: serine protease, partial [Myxococcota bacterium]
RRLARAVGRLDILHGGRRMTTCTATLISPQHILTNHHCVPGDDPRLRVEAVQLRLGYLAAGRVLGRAYDVHPVPLEADPQLDYAVLRVSGNPGAEWGYVPLDVRRAEPGESLFLIHHPAGRPQVITRTDCEVVSSSQAVSSSRLWHRCDTMRGSSGSLVFAGAPGESLAVVGLHYAGFISESPTAHNFAKPMDAVVARSNLLRRLSMEVPVHVPQPTAPPHVADRDVSLIVGRQERFTVTQDSPVTLIRDAWDASQQVTDLSYVGGAWAVTMSDESGPARRQAYESRGDFEAARTAIRSRWNEGLAITDLAVSNGQWRVAMTGGLDWTGQAFIRSETVPRDWIQERWADRHITDINYGPRGWSVVMSRGTGWRAQGWAFRNSSEGLRHYIREHWDEGQDITSLACGRGGYMVVMTEGASQTGQRYAFRTELSGLTEYLQQSWAEGRRLVDVCHDGAQYLVVVSDRV